MAGHSKWDNIQYRKTRQDIKRSKIWTKITREIIIATRESGPNPIHNSSLRIAIEKANYVNMPKNNIQRAIQQGSSHFNDINCEEIRYEGYGISGVAFIIDTITDSRTRTASNIRSAFSKGNGRLGHKGSVSFMFKNYGEFLFESSVSEEQIIEIALDVGVDDVIINEMGFFEITCSTREYIILCDLFRSANLEIKTKRVSMKAINLISLNSEDLEKINKLIKALKSINDVKNIYTNISRESK